MRRVDPVLVHFQLNSSLLLYGKSSNEPTPRRLVFDTTPYVQSRFDPV